MLLVRSQCMCDLMIRLRSNVCVWENNTITTKVEWLEWINYTSFVCEWWYKHSTIICNLTPNPNLNTKPQPQP